jgi:hypothetical protein
MEKIRIRDGKNSDPGWKKVFLLLKKLVLKTVPERSGSE